MLDQIIARSYWGLVFVPGILLALYGRWRFGRAYQRYSAVPTVGKVSGAQAARALLDRIGMANVELYEMSQFLGDHYDPRRRCIFLSSEVASSTTIAAVAVATHVVAHGSQFRQDHRFFRLRMVAMRATGLATNTALILWIIGLLDPGDSYRSFLIAGTSIYGAFILVQLLTLPVEYGASGIAQRELTRHKIIDASEKKACEKMLKATVWIDMPHLLSAAFGVGRLFRTSQDSAEEA